MAAQSPRSAIREEIVNALSEVLECPVFDSYTRDFDKNLQQFVAVFTPSESLRRDGSGGEARPGRPVRRDISVDVVVAVQSPGTGREAADAADTLSRVIELTFNNNFPTLEPTSTSVSFSADELISCLVEMRYSISHLDNMADDNTPAEEI